MYWFLLEVAIAAIVCHGAAEWQGICHTGNLDLHLLALCGIFGEIFLQSLLHDGEHCLSGIGFFYLEATWCKVILGRVLLIYGIRYIYIIVEDVLT